MSRISFLKDSWNYLSSEIATKGLAFISIPVFTKLLTPEEYGYLNVVTSLAGLIIPFVTLNLSVSIGRYYFEKNKEDFDSFFTTSVVLCLVPLIIIFFVSVRFDKELSNFFNIPVKAIVYLIPTSLLLFLSNIILITHRAERKSKILKRITIIRGYLGFLIAVAFMYYLSSDRYIGRFWANLIILGCTIVYFAWYYRKRLKFEILWCHIKYMLNYGLPLLPASISAVLLVELDRLMINSMASSADAGLYSFAYNISMLLLVLSNALHYAFVPDFYKLMNERKHEEILKSFSLIISIVTLGAMTLVFYGSIVGQFLGTKEYSPSLVYIPIIVLGQYFLTYVPLFKQNFSFVKKTIYSSISIIAAGSINAILNYIFIPEYGAIAGAFTTAISYLLQLMIVYLLVRKVLQIKTISLKLIIANSSAVLFSILIYYLIIRLNVNSYWEFFIKTLVIMLFAIIFFKPYIFEFINQKSINAKK